MAEEFVLRLGDGSDSTLVAGCSGDQFVDRQVLRPTNCSLPGETQFGNRREFDGFVLDLRSRPSRAVNTLRGIRSARIYPDGTAALLDALGWVAVDSFMESDF